MMDSQPARPKDSASLVILRGNPAAPEVLLGKRRDEARFMPGYFVFPGGCVEEEDKDLTKAGFSQTSLHAAAMRETWEETAILVARQGRFHVDKASAWQVFLSTNELAPNSEALYYIARAITPPSSPIRFDTRFFLAREDSLLGEAVAVGELPEVCWVAACLAMASGKVAGVTKFVLSQALGIWQRTDLLSDPCRPILHYSYHQDGRLIKQETQQDGLKI